MEQKDIENLIDEVKKSESTKHIWRTKFDSLEFRNASKLNKLLFDKHLNQAKKCECIEDLFFYLNRKNLKSQIMENLKKEFILFPGKIVCSHLHETISEHSTDKECIEALKASPGIKRFFKTLPENWEDIVGVEKEEIEAPQGNVENTHTVNADDLKENVGEDLKEGEKIEIPANEEEGQIEADKAFEVPENIDSMKAADVKALLVSKEIDFDSSLNKAQLIQFVKGLK
jgi:hypothetical protein